MVVVVVVEGTKDVEFIALCTNSTCIVQSYKKYNGAKKKRARKAILNKNMRIYGVVVWGHTMRLIVFMSMPESSIKSREFSSFFLFPVQIFHIDYPNFHPNALTRA